jgi:hypothetical protein
MHNGCKRCLWVAQNCQRDHILHDSCVDSGLHTFYDRWVLPHGCLFIFYWRPIWTIWSVILLYQSSQRQVTKRKPSWSCMHLLSCPILHAAATKVRLSLRGHCCRRIRPGSNPNNNQHSAWSIKLSWSQMWWYWAPCSGRWSLSRMSRWFWYAGLYTSQCH